VSAPGAPNGKPGQEPEAACRALTVRPLSLPPGFATQTLCPHRAGSKDCFQVGPGLPRVWPYRLAPDFSGLTKLGQDRVLFKCALLIARALPIGSHVPPPWCPGPFRAAGDRRRLGRRAAAEVPGAGCCYNIGSVLPLVSHPRQRPGRRAYGTPGWLSPKLEASYKLNRIRRGRNILDLVLGGFLESARCRTCRPQHPNPLPTPASWNVPGPPREAKASDPTAYQSKRGADGERAAPGRTPLRVPA
jgi:hypothetical protein